MCFYIGIEDLIANALIELLEQGKNREIDAMTLESYGAEVVKTLSSEGEEAVLLLSRDHTHQFLQDYSDYFTCKGFETNNPVFSLRPGVDVGMLRSRFRSRMALRVLEACYSEKPRSVLVAA